MINSLSHFYLDKKSLEDYYPYKKIKNNKNYYLDRDANKVIEEVFDKSTLMTLYNLITHNAIDYLDGVVNSGKEARIYRGVKDKQLLAVKIYLVSSSNFKSRSEYMADDYNSASKKGMKNIVPLWVRKEYHNMKIAYDNNIPVPKPLCFDKNVLVMNFIGENGVGSPLLKNSPLSQKDYNILLNIITNLYKKARLVHGDLSEYNIFKFKNKLFLFDFGSSVTINNPKHIDFLKRDINNINKFFSRNGFKTKSLNEILDGMKN